MDTRIAHGNRLHPEAVGAQMLDPRAAAASVGAVIDIQFRHCQRGRAHAGGDAAQQQFQCIASLIHVDRLYLPEDFDLSSGVKRAWTGG